MSQRNFVLGQCAVEHCDLEVDESRLMCDEHWDLVPAHIKRALFHHWQPGHDHSYLLITVDEYRKALRRSCDFITNLEKEHEPAGSR